MDLTLLQKTGCIPLQGRWHNKKCKMTDMNGFSRCEGSRGLVTDAPLTIGLLLEVYEVPCDLISGWLNMKRE